MVLYLENGLQVFLKINYMIKGYAVNQKRLEYLEKTVKLIDIAGRIETELKGTEAQGII